MITRFNKFQLITEDPDSVYYKDDDLHWQDSDARAFAVKTNDERSEITDFSIGDYGEMHSDNNLVSDYGWEFPGRIWENRKLISFWCYPSVKLFKQIVKNIEDELDIEIFNNGWSIEIIRRKGEVVKKDFSEADVEDLYYDEREMGDKSETIPIEEYIGSEDFSDLQKQMHLMGWEEKQRLKEKGIKLAPGFGSDRIAWDKPRNLAYRQTIYQENKK